MTLLRDIADNAVRAFESQCGEDSDFSDYEDEIAKAVLDEATEALSGNQTLLWIDENRPEVDQLILLRGHEGDINHAIKMALFERSQIYVNEAYHKLNNLGGE